jgi:hypothetical protein
MDFNGEKHALRSSWDVDRGFRRIRRRPDGGVYGFPNHSLNVSLSAVIGVEKRTEC